MVTFELWLKLIDNMIAFRKRQEEVNRNLFHDYVQPTMDGLTRVHEAYLDSFEEYRRLLLDPSHTINERHPVFDQLRWDAAKSEHLRAQLASAAIESPNSEVARFEGAVHYYILVSSTRVDLDETERICLRRGEFKQAIQRRSMRPNARRIRYLNCLVESMDHLDLEDPDIRSKLAELTLLAVTELQRDFMSVRSAYQSTKKSLLAAK